ncbi:hypothetical protein V2J09_019753 [Rumex salicifolius]
MELAYNLFVYAFTAILLSFLVAKLVSLTVSRGDRSGRNVSCTGVDNGDKQKGPIGGVQEEKLEKRLKVGGLKGKRKRLKKISFDTAVESDFKGNIESTDSAMISGGSNKADDSVDDYKQLCSVEKDFEFSGIQKQDDYFAVEDPLKKEALISSYEKPLDEGVLQELRFKEVICPIEGLNKVTNQGNDLDGLIDISERRDCGEYDNVIRTVSCEKAKEKESIEPKKDDSIDKQLRVLTSFDVHKEDNVISDDEEWEGIERNELEKDFVRAMNFVNGGWLNKLGSDVIMQFHDLQNIAMEGHCNEPKISTRAKWAVQSAQMNSWQKLGSMNPEEAMEKYIALLSDKVPGWIDGHSYDEE